MLVNRVRQFDAQDKNLDELVEVSVMAYLLLDEYDRRNLDVPDWLTRKCEDLEYAIEYSVRASKQAKLRELIARREAAKTAKEVRRDLDAQIAELQKSLA